MLASTMVSPVLLVTGMLVFVVFVCFLYLLLVSFVTFLLVIVGICIIEWV